ncbi:MAG: hypothetical protein QM754_14845 [Tepidisphaeraceae bacterium]
MVWQSPYREEPKKPPSAVTQWLSRGTMLVIGIVLAYYGVRGLIGLYDWFLHERPSLFVKNYLGRTKVNWIVILAPLGMISLSLIGGTLIAASVLTVETMQSLFERWNRPPVTGDRDGADWRRWNRWNRW